jgi:hypothetical protein
MSDNNNYYKPTAITTMTTTTITAAAATAANSESIEDSAKRLATELEAFLHTPILEFNDVDKIQLTTARALRLVSDVRAGQA